MCFSLLWLIQTLVWLVVVCAVVAVLYKLVPYLLAQLGMASDIVMQVIISVLWLLYDLVSCAGIAGSGRYRYLP